MIAKCSIIALLAIVATALPLGCNQQQSIVVPATESCSQNSRVAVVSSGCESSTAGAVTRNVVAKGKYPVALRNCGPTPDKQIPVTTSTSTAPAQLKPLVRLPSKIPAPRTIAHSCTCYKTIVRPRVHQHIVTVPTVERYLETTHKPVIENIQYEAIPVNCEDTSSSGNEYQFVSAGSESGSSCGAQVQTVEAPRVETVEVPRVEVVEAPRVERVQVQTVEAPRVQVVEAPRVEYVEAPRVEAQRVQVVEAPRVERVQTVEVPRVQSCSSQQTVEFPRSFSFGCQQ